MHRRSRLASLFLVLAVTAASLGLLASNAVFAGGNPVPVFPVPDRLFFNASAAPGTIPGAKDRKSVV